MDNKAGNNFPLIRQSNVNGKIISLTKKPDDINDHPALLTYETNIPVNTYACNSVIMPITLAKIRLCFTV
ncbi:hypothetical protein EIMP300_23840 [Escherichia coli]|uniref:Uncharacterized protein n=1 Tax=Escherichia coli TaxID=562 RepID=A0A8S0FL00_ECOLX|nr:hypothetical protein EIMP300_23840 [Escherichia coli]